MYIVGVSRKIDEAGRVVIPKQLRSRFDLCEGDEVDFIVDSEENIIIQKRETISKHIKKYKSLCDIISEKTNMMCCLISEEKLIVSSNQKFQLGTRVSKQFIENNTYEALNIPLFDIDKRYISKKVYSLMKKDNVQGELVIVDTSNTTRVSDDNDKIIKILIKYLSSISKEL